MPAIDDPVSKVKLGFTSVNGKRLFRAELNDYKGENFDELLVRGGKFIRNEPPGSVLCLCVFNDHTPMVTNKNDISEYLKANKPYIKASAACGFNKFFTPIYNAIFSISGRQDIRVFSSEKEATDWLLSR